jgi:hypothetical protein
MADRREVQPGSKEQQAIDDNLAWLEEHKREDLLPLVPMIPNLTWRGRGRRRARKTEDIRKDGGD